MDTAKQYLGTRYVYGGASPSGFDCSGFTMYVYRQFGYSLPHTATGQWQSGLGTKVWSIGALQPGDLVFYPDDEHVGIVGGRDESGNLLIIHCAFSQNNVVITGLEGFTSIGRPVYYNKSY